MKSIKLLPGLFYTMLSFSFVYGQRSIILQEYNQGVFDIAKVPSGYYVLSQTNHLLPGQRADLQLSSCDNNIVVFPIVQNFYKSDFNLFPGNLAIGSEELNAGYPTGYTFTATALNRSGDVLPVSLITHFNNSVNSVDWVLKTISPTVGTPKCLALPDGDFIFLYNYTNSDLVTVPAISRMSPTGVLLWQKSYELLKERGVDINVNNANDLVLLSDNSIVVAGSYAFNSGDPLTAFAFKIDMDGKIEWVRSFSKYNGNDLHSAQFISVRQSPHSGHIYLLGSENGPTQNRIHLAVVDLAGNRINHTGVEFPLLTDPANQSIHPYQMDVNNIFEKAGIVGDLYSFGSHINFYLLCDQTTGGLFSNYNFIRPFGQSYTVVERMENEKFITARNVLDVGVAGSMDVCIEKINLIGNDEPCYSGFVETEMNNYGLGNIDRKRMKVKRIDNLEPFSINALSGVLNSDYCSAPPSGLMGKINIDNPSNSLTSNSEKSTTIRVLDQNHIILTNDNLQNESEEIDIIDLNGRLLKKIKISIGHLKIEIDDLPAGIYFLRNSADKKTKMVKFIKYK